MNQRPAAILIADLDNTLYNFVDFFAPAFRAMVHALAREIGQQEDNLVDEFRAVYAKHRTVEYSFVVQELPSVAALPVQLQERAIHVARIAFGGVRRKRLRLYPGVADTLRWFVRGGGVVCVLTNAPAHHAYRRIIDLGLRDLISAFGAWEGAVVPSSEPSFADKYLRNQLEADQRFSVSIREQRHRIKPHPAMLEEIYRSVMVPGVPVFAVGDSPEKDLAPCKEKGATTVWARYGRNTDPTNQRTLDSITPWMQADFELHYSLPNLEPDFSITRFSELQQILPVPYQQPLF